MAVPISSPVSCASSSSSCASSSSSSILYGSLTPRSLDHHLCRLRLSTFILSSPPLQHCFSRPSLPSSLACSFAARSMSGSSSAGQIDDLVKDKIAQNPVIVFSKSWCPFCSSVKGLFKELGVKPFVVELDQLVDEEEVQRGLQRLSGQSTVPNVFIGGKHIGGCDDTMGLHQSGNLMPLLKAAGAKFC